MRALFDHYTDAGNVGGDATDLYSDVIKGNTLCQTGDKLIIEYWINSSISDLSINVQLAELNYSVPNADIGNNIIRLILMKTGFVNSRFIISTSNGDSFNSSADVHGDDLNWGLDLALKLTVQDTSETPADSTIVAKMGSVLYIPAS